MSGLNFVDLIIIAIFFFTTLAGLARGFMSQLISLATWVIGIIVASMFASPLASTFTQNAAVQNAMSQTSSSVAQPVSYVAIGVCFFIIFFGVVVAGSLLSSIFNLAFKTGILGIGNRILGGVFGFGRGFVINLLLIFVVQLTSLASEPWWTGSRLVQDFQPAVQWLDSIVSPSLAGIKNTVTQQLQGVGNTLQNAAHSTVSGFSQ